MHKRNLSGDESEGRSANRPKFGPDRELDAALATRERQYLVFKVRDSDTDARRQREGDWLDGRSVHVVDLPITPAPSSLAIAMRVQFGSAKLIHVQSITQTQSKV